MYFTYAGIISIIMRIIHKSHYTYIIIITYLDIIIETKTTIHMSKIKEQKKCKLVMFCYYFDYFDIT